MNDKKPVGETAGCLGFIILCFLFLLFKNCIESESKTPSGPEVNTAAHGEYVYESKDALDSSISSVVHQDKQGYAKTTLGSGFPVSGAHLQTIDTGVGWRKVRVQDGPYQGREGWIPE